MTTRKNTMNFGDKSCRIIHGEKTNLRIINILTREITICFKKILKFLRDLLSVLQKTKMSSTYKICQRVRKPCGLAICSIFLSFTSFERPLLRTSFARQKSRGDKGSPCLTPLLQGKKIHQTAIYSDRKHS